MYAGCQVAGQMVKAEHEPTELKCQSNQASLLKLSQSVKFDVCKVLVPEYADNLKAVVGKT